MPYVNPGIFRKNRTRYKELYEKYYELQKEFRKAEKTSNYELLDILLENAKSFKTKLKNFKFEFKGFLDAITCMQFKKQKEYEEMYRSIIHLSKKTKPLIKEINDYKNNLSTSKRPRIVRKVNT